MLGKLAYVGLLFVATHAVFKTASFPLIDILQLFLGLPHSLNTQPGSVLVKDFWTPPHPPLKSERIEYSLLEQLFGDPPNG